MKAVVITGGGAGIGRAAALLCAGRGYPVAVLDIDGETARAAAAESLSAGAPAAIAIRCDVSREDQVAGAFDEAVRALGPLHGAFANAGMDAGAFVHELPLEMWERVIATNLTGVYLTAKHALRHLLTQASGGSIVCTSSPAASVSFAAGGAGAYSASKGGISALVRCMAVDYARHGIRVNAVVPGATETRLMWANVDPEDMPAMRQQIGKEVPMGRLAAPQEIARAVVWLLSEDASYVTGSHLVCDGGILAKASISV